MQFRSGWQRAVFLLAAALPGLVMGREVVRLSLAARLADSVHLADLRQAIALDPIDPTPFDRLGFIHLYSSKDQDIARAIIDFRGAIRLNPRVALYWLDLASACESNGDRACAAEALERAVSLSPMTPRLRWEAGNYYLRASRFARAWAEFHRLLELAPASYAEATFSLCTRVFRDPRLILNKLLPKGTDPKLLLSYANFLVARADAPDASHVWGRAASGPKPLSFKLAEPYLEQLIVLRRYREALAVWDDLRRQGSVTRPAVANPQNRVFNGGFERSPLNAGFDWRSHDVPYVRIDFGDPAPYRGSRCLRINFTVRRNEEVEPVDQLIPVAPSQSYRLTAFVRSDGITSDSGPRLRVQDPACPDCVDASTATTVRTTPWHSVGLTFTTAAQTQVVRLSVWRPRSRSFPSEITGSFWLDDVTVTALGPYPAGRTP